MVITGDHDTRVMPMHSFKFAAALQTAQAGPAPVLLAVDLSSGHGGGGTGTPGDARGAEICALLAPHTRTAGPRGGRPRPSALGAPPRPRGLRGRARVALRG